MQITNRLTVVAVDSTDGDRTWDPEHVLTGALDVTTNSSSATVKTFPGNSTLFNSDKIASGDATEVLIRNHGSADFSIAVSGFGFVAGDPVVPAGGFRLVKFVVSYPSSGLAIFCI